MKIVGVILALVLYVWGLAAPFLPLVDYVVKYDYYKNVLCVNQDKPEMHCNGQCVLMQKLQAEADKQKPAPVTFSPEEDLTLYDFDTWSYTIFQIDDSQPKSFAVIRYCSWFDIPLTPPPQA